MDTHQNKQQILETITAVSRLILLSFKPQGTKISIRDHNIVLCEPSCERIYGFRIQQGLGRYLNGDSREDIYVLNHVICHFIEWYIVPNKSDDIELYRAMIQMAKYLCVSLRELQATYQTGTVVGMLQYYIIVLMSVITDTYDPRILYQPKRGSSHIAFSTIFDIDKFKSFWSRDELLSISNQFDKCFRMPYDPEIALFRNSTPNILVPSKLAPCDIAPSKMTPSKMTPSNLVPDHLVLDDQIPDNRLSDNRMPDNRLSDNRLSGNGMANSRLSGNRLSGNGMANSRLSGNGMANNETDEPDESDNESDNGIPCNVAPCNIALDNGMPVIPEPIDESVGKPPDTIKSIVMPVIQSLSNVIVQGHLVGITNILDMMDKRFTMMLSKSVKGI